jgi:hypothetical protein
LYLTTISIAEIELGLLAPPEGNRRRLLAARFEQFVELAFAQSGFWFSTTRRRISTAEFGRSGEHDGVD